MASPTRELLYAGLLYLGVSRFLRGAEPILIHGVKSPVPASFTEKFVEDQLGEQLSKLKILLRAKELINLESRSDLVKICRGSGTGVVRTVEVFLHEISLRKGERRIETVGRGASYAPFFDDYKTHLETMSDLYDNAHGLLGKLETLYPAVAELKQE